MKRPITSVIIASLLTAMGACSSDEPVADSTRSQGGVTFDVSCYKAPSSRGTVYTSSSSLQNQRLKVFSHRTSTGEAFLNTMPLFWENTQWYLNSKNDVFYAPSTGIAYYAWGPYSGNGANITNTGAYGTDTYNSANKTLTITGFTVKDKVKEHVDFLVAGNKTPTTSANGTLTVPLHMQHALAQVKFFAYVPNRVLSIEIIGIRLTQVYSKGNFLLKADNIKTGAVYDVTKGWANRSTPKSYFIDLVDPITVNNTSHPTISNRKELASSVVGDMIVLPYDYSTSGYWSNYSSTSGARISLLCRVYTVDRNGDKSKTLLYPTSGDKYSFIAVPLKVELKAGVCNIITLRFDGAGQVDPDMKNPDNASDNRINANPDSKKTPGEFVLNDPITFEINYVDWVDGGSGVLDKMDF